MCVHGEGEEEWLLVGNLFRVGFRQWAAGGGPAGPGGAFTQWETPGALLLHLLEKASARLFGVWKLLKASPPFEIFGLLCRKHFRNEPINSACPGAGVQTEAE